jgi:two-component system copper resistance phosphate regulon response regulator CusR
VDAPKGIVKGSVLNVGDLQMDFVKHEVRKGGRVIVLSKKEFDLLVCFMHRPGQVLSQTVLSQHLYQTDFDRGTNLIEVHIKHLRAKIDPPTGPSLIRTVRGYGYILDA